MARGVLTLALLIAAPPSARAQDASATPTEETTTPEETTTAPEEPTAPEETGTESEETGTALDPDPTETEEPLAEEPSAAAPASTEGVADEAHVVPEGDRRDPAWFRGRERDATAEEVALWIPRILFFPLHLVAEAVRQPLLALLSWAEENHLFGILPVLFHPTDEVWWHPTLSLEAGIFALPGLTIRFEDLGVEGHDMRIAGTFGGDEFWSVHLRDRWQLGPVRIGVRGGYASRPNNQFFGLGQDAPKEFVFYRSMAGDAIASVVVEHEDHVEVEVAGGYSYEEVGPGYAPSIELSPEAVTRLGLSRYDLLLVSAEVRLDTREEVEENGGVHLHAGGLYGVTFEGTPAHFLRFDVDLEGAVEIYPDRVLALRGHLIETASLDGHAIPFLHLPSLGWELHRGFVGGRFRGEAAVVAELRYRYPIHYFVDMEWTVSAGNVVARDFSDFAVGALTGALSVGFRTRRTGFDPISFALAFGTTQFDRFDLDGVRFYVASTHGL